MPLQAFCWALAVDLCPQVHGVTLGPLAAQLGGHRRRQLQPLPGAHGLGLGHIVIFIYYYFIFFIVESWKTVAALK